MLSYSRPYADTYYELCDWNKTHWASIHSHDKGNQQLANCMGGLVFYLHWTYWTAFIHAFCILWANKWGGVWLLVTGPIILSVNPDDSPSLVGYHTPNLQIQTVSHLPCGEVWYVSVNFYRLHQSFLPLPKVSWCAQEGLVITPQSCTLCFSSSPLSYVFPQNFLSNQTEATGLELGISHFSGHMTASGR